MLIRRKISFYLQKVYPVVDGTECQIRMRVRWGKNIAQFNAGFTVDPKKWDVAASRCKRNISNKRGYSSSDINKELNRLDDLANDTFKSFEVLETDPTLVEYKNAFNAANGKQVNIANDRTLNSYFIEFTTEQGSLNGWTEGTYYKFTTLKKHLLKFKSTLSINDFTKANLLSFIEHLRDEADLQNSTILKSWKLLSWFLRWADDKNYLTCKDYQKFKPGLNTVKDKEIIFLDWDELMTVYNMVFPEDKKYLDRTRDVFCFGCFTSLRYSDMAKLKSEDIQGDTIKVVISKTGKFVNIELNKYSRSILEKYKGQEPPLPVISNQKMNEYIKEVCYLAGINNPVTKSYYKGSNRIDEVHPKYKMIGTHSARRTFICNALMMGIAPITVMEWTGHSDYKAMKPYIKIADRAKKEAMSKFDDK